jgi:NitT/TauT family transport system permease protein
MTDTTETRDVEVQTSEVSATEANVSAQTSDDKPKGQWRWRMGTLAVAVLIFAVWEFLPRLGIVSPIILPPFTEVSYALYTLVQQDFFAGHFMVTLNEVFWGFVIGTAIGLLGGILFGVWEPLKRLMYPFVVAFQAIPKIVLAPLLISWFGYGQASKIVMAIVISFFPVFINTMVGLENVPGDSLRLMRSLRASPMQTFRKVSLPSAAPLMFAGVKTALTFALIGAIVGEFVGASEGLGFLLHTYNFQLRIDRVFAVIIILSAVGAIFYLLLEWLDNKLIFWRQDGVH